MRPHALLAALLASQAAAVPHPSESLPSRSQPPRSLDRRDWPSIDEFLAKVTSIFPASLLVTSSCSLMNYAGGFLSEVFGIDVTENDPCGDVTMIFARGTCDAGNVGVWVGPWVAKSLQDKLGSRTLGVKGFDYPATVKDYLTGSKPNGVTLAKMIKSTVAQCPNTKLVIGGHSQGSMVVHNAAADLDAAIMAQISAIVLFGDPYSAQPVANIDPSKVKVYCHLGDNICVNGPILTIAHFTYSADADDAAAFIVSKL